MRGDRSCLTIEQKENKCRVNLRVPHPRFKILQKGEHLMRVIQTTAYFDPDLVKEATSRSAENPGVTFAWFKASEQMERLSVFNLFRDYTVALSTDAQSSLVRSFLDAAVRGAKFNGVPPLNPDVVSALTDASIVIEQSPPLGIPLSTLMSRAPSVAIGTYIGMQAAGGISPWLMFVTVPTGILVIGSAIGVAKALEKGLNQRISALIEGRPLPPPSKRPRKLKNR